MNGTTAPSPLYNSPWPPGITTNSNFPIVSTTSNRTSTKINIAESPTHKSKVLVPDSNNKGYRRVSQNFGIFFSNMEEREDHTSTLNQSGAQIIDLRSFRGHQPTNSIHSSKPGSRASSLVPSDEIDLERERVTAAVRDPSQEKI